MSIDFNKQFYKIEKSFDDVHDLNNLLSSNITIANKNILLEKISELQHNLINYKTTIKNIYIKDDKIGKNQ
jgi:hypothetical protein